MYAGFWRRAVAIFIDIIIVSLFNYLLHCLLFGAAATAILMENLSLKNGVYNTSATQGVYGTYDSIECAIMWLYSTLLESSKLQATIGKKILGVKVTDMNGNRIGFGCANVRFFSKILSMIILYIGFFMAGFTKKKQALHDIIAKTLVVRN